MEVEKQELVIPTDTVILLVCTGKESVLGSCLRDCQGGALAPWECDSNYVKHLLHNWPGNKVRARANYCRTLAHCFDPSLIQCLLVSITIAVSKDKNLAFCLCINSRQVT